MKIRSFILAVLVGLLGVFGYVQAERDVECGSNAKFYTHLEIGWPDSGKFCSAGSEIHAVPFPPEGGSVEWECSVGTKKKFCFGTRGKEVTRDPFWRDT